MQQREGFCQMADKAVLLKKLNRGLLRMTLAWIMVIVLTLGVSAETAFASTNKGLTAADRESMELSAHRQMLHPVAVDVDGERINFSKYLGEPFIDDNSRTLVPLRITMENLGINVSWDQDSQTAICSKDGINVTVRPGERYIRKNGFEIPIDTEAVNRDSRIYLPIRAVAEAFGAEVSWNQMQRTVIISSPKVKDNIINVHFVDVAHGDCTFIDYGDYEILIDAGYGDQGQNVADYIRPYVSGNLELVIATHAHADHLGGLPKVLENFTVDRIIDSGSSVDTPEYAAYQAAISQAEQKGTKLKHGAREKETITLGDEITLDIMQPMTGAAIENNNCLATLFTYKDVTLLLSADCQEDAEKVLSGKVGMVNVFKAGHHGSFNANSTALLEKIIPEYVIVSAGKGLNYHHPHAAALKRLLKTGCLMYGTFLSGCIVMSTDGASYSFSTKPTPGTYLEKPLQLLRLADAGTYQNNVDDSDANISNRIEDLEQEPQ